MQLLLKQSNRFVNTQEVNKAEEKAWQVVLATAVMPITAALNNEAL